jgi:hypothetical protein
VKRLLTCLLFLGLAGCSSPLDQEKAGDVARAVGEDHARLADLTHHFVVEGPGDREKFIGRREDLAAELRRQGVRYGRFVVGEPSELFEAGREVSATVPVSPRLTRTRDGTPGSKPSYLIAVSKDRGASRVFVDGDSVGDDRAKLRQMLPNAPAGLPLKAAVGPVREDE